MELNFALHEKQAEIFNSPARFKVCAAGRRGGKSYLSAVMLLIEGLKNENERGYNLADKRVFYVAPTYDQGKRIIWDLLKSMGKEVIKSTLENQGIMTLINGRKILRPTLSDVEGHALFIGTPEGKNHFYDLFMQATEDKSGEYGAFSFASIDNVFTFFI